MNGLGWDEMDGWKDGRWMGWMVRKRVRWAASCLGLVLVLHGRSAAGGAQAERGDGGTKDEHQQWREWRYMLWYLALGKYGAYRYVPIF